MQVKTEIVTEVMAMFGPALAVRMMAARALVGMPKEPEESILEFLIVSPPPPHFTEMASLRELRLPAPSTYRPDPPAFSMPFSDELTISVFDTCRLLAPSALMPFAAPNTEMPSIEIPLESDASIAC